MLGESLPLHPRASLSLSLSLSLPLSLPRPLFFKQCWAVAEKDLIAVGKGQFGSGKRERERERERFGSGRVFTALMMLLLKHLPDAAEIKKEEKNRIKSRAKPTGWILRRNLIFLMRIAGLDQVS